MRSQDLLSWRTQALFRSHVSVVTGGPVYHPATFVLTSLHSGLPLSQ